MVIRLVLHQQLLLHLLKLPLFLLSVETLVVSDSAVPVIEHLAVAVAVAVADVVPV